MPRVGNGTSTIRREGDNHKALAHLVTTGIPVKQKLLHQEASL